MPFRLHPGVAFVRPFPAGLAAMLLLMLPAPAPRPAPNAPAAGEASRAPQFRIYPYPTSGVGTNRLPNLTNVVDSFQVKNTGTTALTIALEESCSGSITCVSISTSQVSLNPGAATNVRVTYNTGSPGSATLNLFGEDVGGQALPRSSSPPLTFSVAVGAVVVTPDGATASPWPGDTASRWFTVANQGIAASYTISVSCFSAAATDCAVSPSALALAPYQTDSVRVSYRAGAAGTSGSVSVLASGGTWSDTGSLTVTPTAVVVQAPKGITRSIPAGTGLTEPFTVKKQGLGAITVSFQARCDTSVVAGGNCGSPANEAFTSAPSDTVRTVTLGYTSNVAGRIGLMALRGVVAAKGVVDSGWVALTTSQTSVVQMVRPVAQPVLARDLCLAFGLGEGAAWECGDLRLTHALPAFSTKNRTRAPLLLYNSAHVKPRHAVMAIVTVPYGVNLPDSVEAVLKVGGVQKALGRWGGAAWNTASRSRWIQVGYAYDGAGSGSAAVGFTLEVANLYGANRVASPILSGTALVVRRTASPLGEGWWLSGLEQLDPATKLWVGGDGSAAVYAATADPTRWVAPAIDFPDTLRQVGTEYVRTLPGKVELWFDAQGRHVRTVGVHRDTTLFGYDGQGRIQTITVPTPAGGANRAYTFTYGANLVTVTDGIGAAPRQLTLNLSAGRVASIVDPDTTTVTFAYYTSGAASGLPYSRTDRVGTSRVFSWSPQWKVTEDTARTATTFYLSEGFNPVETQGVAPVSVDTAQLATTYRNPRAYVTSFQVDGYGQPVRITDAKGGVTTLARSDTRWPARVTRLRRANGHVLSATYDGRGRIVTSTDSGAVVRGSPQAVTTGYGWNDTWDKIARIAPPGGWPVTFGYDAVTGDRTFERDSAGNQVTYTYHSSSGPLRGLVASIQDPVGGLARVEYDSVLGNVRAVISPLSFRTEFVRDAYGRDTLTRSPVDSAQTLFQTVRRSYDVVDQLRTEESNGPGFTYFSPIDTANRTSPAMQLLTTNDYDDQGRLTSSETQDMTTGTLVRIHVVHHYDALGRDTLSSNGGGGWITTRYDAAGNVIFLRRGPNDSMAVTLEYDELNRLVKRRTPARAYVQSCASPSCWKPAPLYPNNGTGLVIPVDSAMFTYDAVGSMLTAANRYARVTRAYAPNGALLSDELNFASYGGSGFSYSAPYPLAFQYDSVGRRVVLGFPSNLGGGTQTYAYDPATGALKTVTDRSGNRFEYTDDAMGRLRFLRTYTPGNVNGVTQEWTYDPDSRVVTRTFASASGVGSADGTRRYDARGKLLAAQASGPGYGVTTSLAMSYDGLGGLLLSTVNYVSLAKQEEYRRDAFGNPLFEGTLGETNRPTPLTYQYGANGRLQRREANLPSGTPVCGYTYPDTLVQSYDVFGNLSRRTRATYLDGAPGTCTQTGTGLDYEFHWYGADNKLMVLQRDAGSPDRTVRTGTWEEYWYDALGRRILIRERREDLANGSNMESALTQVLWDGDRLLFELRSQPPNGQGGGPASRYGTLGSIHGRELDAPLALTDGRILIPDWRGAYQGSVFASGAPADCATGQANPCMAIEFPAGNIAATFRQFVVSPSGVTYTWRGSLIGAGRDGSGLMYRRNRYYDPLTGRFTQTDPIGIAGGLNLYGFGNGDPVNFSDPFGLCPPCLPFVDPAFIFPHYVRKTTATSGTLASPGLLDPVSYVGPAELKGAGLLFGAVGRMGKAGLRAGAKVPLPKLKRSPFGPKVADEIPNGVPRNWSRDQIEDVIVDYETSIASRKAEMEAFDALGGGSATERLAHARRISQEEAFLKSLEKARRDRR